MTNKEKITALREVHDLVLNHPVHDPDLIAEGKSGKEVNWRSRYAVRWCFLGAIWKTVGTSSGEKATVLENILREQSAFNRLEGFTETLRAGNAPLVVEQAIAELSR